MDIIIHLLTYKFVSDMHIMGGHAQIAFLVLGVSELN